MIVHKLFNYFYIGQLIVGPLYIKPKTKTHLASYLLALRIILRILRSADLRDAI